MNNELKKVVDEWLEYDKNPKSRKIVQDKLENEIGALEKMFIPRISFGTAGIRGFMGPGYANINDLVIIQTSQGVCKALTEHDNLKNGIFIGYDGRHNSKKWAELTARVFIEKGIKVYISNNVVPTPYVAFGVKKFNCCAGIMVTASHNPSQDNGYKVYWSNGAQIIPPIDKNIASCILESLQPQYDYYDGFDVFKNPLRIDPISKGLEESYSNAIFNSSCFRRERNSTAQEIIVYSAMHGVGYRSVAGIMERFGFPPVVPVEEQAHPDPDFPTVKYPNPEEGDSALDLSIKLANSIGSKIILANDPDADRLALAEKSGDKWTIFTGNQIGIMLGTWLYEGFMKANPDFEKKNLWMLSSAVSSKFLRTLSEREGFNWAETLTGFKWMGNKIDELYKDKSQKVIFAYEEAIGFMPNDVVWDKDGVSTSAVARELIEAQYEKGANLGSYLEDIFGKYGAHLTNNGYLISHDPSKTSKMFKDLRSWKDGRKVRVGESVEVSYPRSCCNYKILAIRDLTMGYDDETPDRRPLLPKSCEFITFKLEGGITLSLRTSGTEPKIKYYSEIIGKPQQERVTIEQTLDEFIKGMVQEFFRPKENLFSYTK